MSETTSSTALFAYHLTRAHMWLDRLIVRADEQAGPNAEPLDVVNAFYAFDYEMSLIADGIWRKAQ